MISRNKMKRTLNPLYLMQYVRKFSVNQDTSSCQICLYHRRTDRQRQTSFDCTISGQEANKSDLLVFKTDFPPNHNASEIKFFFSFFLFTTTWGGGCHDALLEPYAMIGGQPKNYSGGKIHQREVRRRIDDTKRERIKHDDGHEGQ